MKRILSTIAALGFIGVSSVGTAIAATPAIENAKAQCAVGEQTDGYLGVVDGAAPSEAVKREVRTINQQRKAAFADLAARNGITIEDAAALTGKRLVEGAAPGQCVRMPDGAWVRQP